MITTESAVAMEVMAAFHDGILWLLPYPGVTPELIGSVPDVLLLRFGLSYFKH